MATAAACALAAALTAAPAATAAQGMPVQHGLPAIAHTGTPLARSLRCCFRGLRSPPLTAACLITAGSPGWCLPWRSTFSPWGCKATGTLVTGKSRTLRHYALTRVTPWGASGPARPSLPW